MTSALPVLDRLRTKIFADGADIDGIVELARDPTSRLHHQPDADVEGGVTDYEAFARQILAEVTDRPISFEVFADEADEMHRQAKRIATWGNNVYVKIPVTNTRGESMAPLVRELSERGRQGQRHGAVHAAPGRDDRRAVADGAPQLHLGVRRPHRRHRASTRCRS